MRRHISIFDERIHQNMYSKICLKRPLKKKTKIVFQDQLSLNAGQVLLQYFRPSLSYHLPFRPLFLSIFEWPLKTGFTYHKLDIGCSLCT